MSKPRGKYTTRKCPRCGSIGPIVDPQWLRGERQDAEVTLREMARRLGVSATYLSDVERGRRAALPRIVAAYACVAGSPEETQIKADIEFNGDPGYKADFAFLLAELDAARAREAKLREAATKTTANLRHAYANLFSTTMSADDTRRFADGLIAPEIRRLEAALAEGEDTHD